MRARLTISLLAIVAAFVCCAGLQAQIAVANNKFLLTDNQFNSWLMNGSGRNEAPEKFLESQLNLKIDSITTVIELTEEQQERLQLAGSGDIARYIRDVEVLRHELVGQSYDQNKIMEPYQKIQPLALRRQNGLFEEDSLLSKVMHTALSTEEYEKYEGHLAERWNRRYQATVKTQIATLQTSIPMTADQREALGKLLDIPPKRSQARQSYLQMYVFYQLSQISEEDLKKVFDEAQVEALTRFGSQYARLEATLKNQGILP
ncbi:hypothetical protein [Blastopirellula marina]|uniref:Peptidylprolyl isomerase n=1 Tax=Blastopirellula marina TaxID=124 RepID=A0A2S8FA72_9BACT|nr:hypothetical protein [Blastopirellula marina]PQO29068.1 hypothetical protein C5Y98_22960 [Blastopirellula marina]PTL42340.1 hypothetical protein C5Y97_22970 [Blastopirellula marina]